MQYSLNRSFDIFRAKDEDTVIAAQTKRAIKIIKNSSVSEERREIINKVYQGLEQKGEFTISLYTAQELARLEDKDIMHYLFHRYRYVTYPVSKTLDDWPPCLQIEPASVCNFRCKFCYQSDESFSSKGSGHMGIMSLDCFKKIVDQIEGKIEFVTLASRGEPLLARDFIPMIEYTKGKFLSLKVNTNGSILTETQSHAMLASGVATLVFSADSADEALYKELRVNGDFKKTLKNIEIFRDIRAKHYPDSKIVTRVSGVMVNSKKQNINSMLKVWGELVDQVSFVKYSPWERIYQAQINDITESCSDLWRRMFVWYDGSVCPCDNDYKATLKVGSILDKNISQLWRSKEYESLRKTHLDKNRGEIEPCKRCVVS